MKHVSFFVMCIFFFAVTVDTWYFFFEKGYVAGIFFAVAMLKVVFIFRLALNLLPGTIICKMAITGNAKHFI